MELEGLTEEVFTEHLNTKFYIQFEDRRVELELVKVVGDKSTLDKIEGVNRFALYFLGPRDLYIPQHTYRLEHDALGSLDIFIVPVALRDKGYEYEAVFSQMEE